MATPVHQNRAPRIEVMRRVGQMGSADAVQSRGNSSLDYAALHAGCYVKQSRSENKQAQAVATKT